MPFLYYNAANFPAHRGAALSGRHRMDVSWEELVWAAISMGKPGVAFLLAHGWHSYADIVVRSHTIYASLQGGVRFEKSSLYKALDPTEKGATSYFMGMVAAKILGMRLLDVPWLFHLSMFKALGGHTVLASNSEPDLVGLTRRGEWIISEAKGRTGYFDARAMENAKRQTRQLRRINGQFPILRVGVQAFFTPLMEWAIEDPDEFDESARDVDVELREILGRYYSSLLGSNERSYASEIFGRKYLVHAVPEIGISVGVDAQIPRELSSQDAINWDVFDSNNAEQPKKEGQFVTFPDGIAIALDERWDATRMIQDPTLRRFG